ncbi:MAG: glycosyltransferase N-terminal domain-containing protein [Flavobacteriaceae bacterium]
MQIVYNYTVILISWFIKPLVIFNKKLRLFVNGRKETFQKLKSIQKTDNVIWFHCASLGEFEQGRPVIEKYRNEFPNHKIVLTFFSPSGYEMRKNYSIADVVCYLPLDTINNAKRFLDTIHPQLVIFVKYEFWPNILNELQKRQIETLLISGIFREDQLFFKKGIVSSFMKKSLSAFQHFFVQDDTSIELLHKIGYLNVTKSGDTRFDRVNEITKQDNSLQFVSDFVQNKHVLVAGSTWKKDEELLIEYINNYASDNEKFIIAPHNIKNIDTLKKGFSKEVTLFSDKVKNNSANVLIIDTIGLLSKIYSYANIAYIGGGFGAGIHNILEPATFGMPLIIGPKFQKFNEAKDLINLKGCFVVKNTEDLRELLCQFKENGKSIKETANITKNYIASNIGATKCIISYIKKNSSILQS